MDWRRNLAEYYNSHRGAIIGGIIGLVVGVAFLIFGFFKVLFVALCIGLGYYIGKNISEDKNFIRNLKDRLFPPRMYK
ncbi:MAG: DUF2273 domain-containing protein [Firmicutes bacterium]|nr:DUF2273 domain-containing protein [Bacillota bacterium]